MKWLLQKPLLLSDPCLLMHIPVIYVPKGHKKAADGALHVRWDLSVKINTLELLEHPHCALVMVISYQRLGSTR